MMETPLNLPRYDARTRVSPETQLTEIWDPQRRRWVRLTPEEWVRQHFVHHLIHDCHYPAGRVGNEVSIHVGKTSKRCDTVVYGDTAGQALMIVEYKAPSVALTQAVFDQVSRYNLALHVDWLLVSNGLQHYCCHLIRQEQRWEFLQGIPAYQELTQR